MANGYIRIGDDNTKKSVLEGVTYYILDKPIGDIKADAPFPKAILIDIAEIGAPFFLPGGAWDGTKYATDDFTITVSEVDTNDFRIIVTLS